MADSLRKTDVAKLVKKGGIAPEPCLLLKIYKGVDFTVAKDEVYFTEGRVKGVTVQSKKYTLKSSKNEFNFKQCFMWRMSRNMFTELAEDGCSIVLNFIRMHKGIRISDGCCDIPVSIAGVELSGSSEKITVPVKVTKMSVFRFHPVPKVVVSLYHQNAPSLSSPIANSVATPGCQLEVDQSFNFSCEKAMFDEVVDPRGEISCLEDKEMRLSSQATLKLSSEEECQNNGMAGQGTTSSASEQFDSSVITEELTDVNRGDQTPSTTSVTTPETDVLLTAPPKYPEVIVSFDSSPSFLKPGATSTPQDLEPSEKAAKSLRSSIDSHGGTKTLRRSSIIETLLEVPANFFDTSRSKLNPAEVHVESPPAVSELQLLDTSRSIQNPTDFRVESSPAVCELLLESVAFRIRSKRIFKANWTLQLSHPSLLPGQDFLVGSPKDSGLPQYTDFNFQQKLKFKLACPQCKLKSNFSKLEICFSCPEKPGGFVAHASIPMNEILEVKESEQLRQRANVFSAKDPTIRAGFFHYSVTMLNRY